MNRSEIDAVERDEVKGGQVPGRTQARVAGTAGVPAPEREPGADAGGTEPAFPA